jgi:hypothetical protein
VVTQVDGSDEIKRRITPGDGTLEIVLSGRTFREILDRPWTTVIWVRGRNVVKQVQVFVRVVRPSTAVQNLGDFRVDLGDEWRETFTLLFGARAKLRVEHGPVELGRQTDSDGKTEVKVRLKRAVARGASTPSQSSARWGMRRWVRWGGSSRRHGTQLASGAAIRGSAW